MVSKEDAGGLAGVEQEERTQDMFQREDILVLDQTALFRLELNVETGCGVDGDAFERPPRGGAGLWQEQRRHVGLQQEGKKRAGSLRFSVFTKFTGIEIHDGKAFQGVSQQGKSHEVEVKQVLILVIQDKVGRNRKGERETFSVSHTLMKTQNCGSYLVLYTFSVGGLIINDNGFRVGLLPQAWPRWVLLF